LIADYRTALANLPKSNLAVILQPQNTTESKEARYMGPMRNEHDDDWRANKKPKRSRVSRLGLVEKIPEWTMPKGDQCHLLVLSSQKQKTVFYVGGRGVLMW